MIYKSNLIKDFYKPGEVAKMLGVNPMTIINYDNQGLIKFERTINQRRIISRENLIAFLDKKGLLLVDDLKSKKDVVYCRVSTHRQQQSGDLQRQQELILNYVALHQPKEVIILKEVASGLNDNRKQLNKLLDMILNNEVNRIFISYKDRLTRFGYNYIKKICDYYNVEIIVVAKEQNNKTIQEELAEDLCSIIHSFSGKLYGLRHIQRKEIENNINSIKDLGGGSNEGTSVST